MEALAALFQWIGANEAVLSGLAASIVIVGVLFTPLGAGLRAYLRRRRSDEPASVAVVSSSESAAPLPMVRDRPSIAVLPFRNRSGDPEHEYLADGLTEDVIASLSRVRQFFVIAGNTTFTYKGRAVDVREVSRDLGVRYVLEGSVRPVGERVRVHAELVDATTGQQRWAERFERPLAEIFAVQDEVTEAIVAALQPALRRAEAERARRAPTESLDAWAIVNGAWTRLQGDLGSREAMRTAGTAAERAIALDPDYALAHAVLAYALGLEFSARAPAEAERASLAARAETSARRARELDPDDAHVQHCYGAVMANLGRTDDAVRAYERALAVDPNNAQARAGLGISQLFQLRTEEGLQNIERALRLSPRDPLAYHWLAYRALALLVLDRAPEALVDARASVERVPGSTGQAMLAVALGLVGSRDEAAQAYAAVEPYLREHLGMQDWESFARLVTRSDEERARLVRGLSRAAGQGG